MNTSRKICFTVIVVLGLLYAQSRAAIFIELPTLGGQYSEAWGVNNFGVVVGEASTGGDPYKRHAVIWWDKNGNDQAEPNEMVDLGTLPGESSSPPTSKAYSINDAGVVVGDTMFFIPDCERAFRWSDVNGNRQSDPNEMVDLGTLGGTDACANGINDKGVVVGAAITAHGQCHAFRYAGTGPMQDLGLLPGGDTSVAWAINNQGVIVGRANIEPSPWKFHACMWVDGHIVDLRTLGGFQSAAWGINDKGIIVGDSKISGNEHFHAVMWDVRQPERIIDLGALDPNGSTFAYAINNYGVVVGTGWRTAYNTQHAAMYMDGRWIDLQETYFSQYQYGDSLALGINDNGWIVGIGDYTSGQRRGWVLKLDYNLKSDLNKDGIVNFFDFAIMADEWLKKEPWYPGGQ